MYNFLCLTSPRGNSPGAYDSCSPKEQCPPTGRIACITGLGQTALSRVEDKSPPPIPPPHTHSPPERGISSRHSTIIIRYQIDQQIHNNAMSGFNLAAMCAENPPGAFCGRKWHHPPGAAEAHTPAHLQGAAHCQELQPAVSGGWQGHRIPERGKPHER